MKIFFNIKYLYILFLFLINFNVEAVTKKNSNSISYDYLYTNFSFKMFKKEFIYTNNNEDFLRSVLRIYPIYKKTSTVYLKKQINTKITFEERKKINFYIEQLSKQAVLKANFKTNTFYEILSTIVKLNNKWHHSVLYEKLIVKKILKKVDKSIHKNRSLNQTYYIHILNNSRYEILVNFLNLQKVQLQKLISPKKKLE